MRLKEAEGVRQLTFDDVSEEMAGVHEGCGPVRLDMSDAEVYFYRSLFSPDESDAYYEEILDNTAWAQEQIRLYDKVMDVPRLTAWYGDVGRDYAYSGIAHKARPWTPSLLAIKQRVERVSPVTFNSVLLNLYRDGRDSVARHSDDETELGSEPVIGSVTFGEPRSFVFRHKVRKDLRLKLELPHGSCLLMMGGTQRNWLHEVPKTSRPVGPRINLTFRVIGGGA